MPSGIDRRNLIQGLAQGELFEIGPTKIQCGTRLISLNTRVKCRGIRWSKENFGDNVVE